MSEKTLAEARAYVKKNVSKGVKCPCCTQYVKLYKRKLNSSMAYGLILISQNRNGVDTSQWFHLEKYMKPLPIPPSIRSDLPGLKNWGLIEPMDGKREDGNPSAGFYRITNKGRLFVEQKMMVPEYVLLFNKKKVADGGAEIDISIALDNKFNYQELMSS
jgi:hypothetical protein